MNAAHPELGPELRRLAQAILDGLDPVVRMAAAMTAGGGVGTGKCQQIWCPVCALAAVATGDQHPLITVIADHSIGLLEAIRAIVDDVDHSAKPPPDGPPGDGQDPDPDATTTGEPHAATRYQPIPVTIED